MAPVNWFRMLPVHSFHPRSYPHLQNSNCPSGEDLQIAQPNADDAPMASTAATRAITKREPSLRFPIVPSLLLLMYVSDISPARKHRGAFLSSMVASSHICDKRLLAAEGEREEAIEKFRSVAASFESLGMHGDAARVKLDIAEELLRDEEWPGLEEVAREAAETFARNDTRAHLAEALVYLRHAVEHRAATPELLAYVRTYLSVELPTKFEPPSVDRTVH